MNSLDKDYLLDWLPEVFRDTSAENLLNIMAEMFGDIHSQIGQLPDSVAPQSAFFDPPVGEEGPTAEQQDYLEWFSSWVNLLLSEEWEQDQKRDILAKILPLYKKRGTREGLTQYLKIYAGEGIVIEDDRPPIQVGDSASAQVGENMIIGGFPPDTAAMQLDTVSEVGRNAVVEGFPPYFFIVRAAVSVSGPAALTKKRKAIVKILEMEKPAHTWYRLWVRGPTFEVGDPDTAILGQNTII